jgi:hypothetical protein
MVQDRKSRVTFLMKSIDLFQLICNPSSRTMAVGVVLASNRKEYQESSLGSKGQSVCKADNLTAICEPVV